MSGKVVIITREYDVNFTEVSCIITFNDKCLSLKICKEYPTIFIDPNRGYKRFYLNFRQIEKEISKRLFSYFFNLKNLIDYTFSVSLFCLNYYYLKIHGHSFERLFKPNYLYKEISKIIEANYHYYSVSCAILTTLFFTKLGLPSSLPKIFEYTYGFDFLDNFFFPISCVFTVFEYTNDLLLGERCVDPLYISKAFISFLLWPKSKVFLKIPLKKLIYAGANKKDIWITL